MPDINRNIKPPAEPKRSTPDFLRQLRESGHPVVLTINGTTELVLHDSASYQGLIVLAERAERIEALRESVADMRAGRVTPAADMLAELRQILAEQNGG